MSLWMNSLGEFVDRDSDADAELRRRQVYAGLRKVDARRLQGNPARVAAGKRGAAKRAETMRDENPVTICPECGKEFAYRKGKKFCGAYCQKKWHYKRRKGEK